MKRFLGWFCLATTVLACGACGDDRSPVAPPPPPPPPPAPTLSGFVRDDNGSPLANHEVVLEAFFTGHKQATTSTNVDGYYEMVLGSTTGSSFIHAGGGEYEHHYAQALVNIVQNLRLRRLRTVEVGQSVAISIDRDSSLAVDGGDWWMSDKVWERLHVRVPDAGILTIEARPEVGNSVPSLMLFCCPFDWVEAPAGSPTASPIVKANSLFEIRIAIPTASAPQRFEVRTSLQR